MDDDLLRSEAASKLTQLLKDDDAAGWYEAARWIDSRALGYLSLFKKFKRDIHPIRKKFGLCPRKSSDACR